MAIHDGVADDYEELKRNMYNVQKITPETVTSDNYLIHKLSIPKTIATISICNAIHINITDNVEWTPPTEEQIKNLHDMFCIDVTIL